MRNTQQQGNFKRFLGVMCIALSLFIVSACGGTKGSSTPSPYKQVGGSGKRGDDSSAPDRLNNLEQRIDIIETDLRQLRPSIEGLVAIEKDIQDLVRELAGLTGERDTLRSSQDYDVPPQYSASAPPTPLKAEPVKTAPKAQPALPQQTPQQAPQQTAPTPLIPQEATELKNAQVAPAPTPVPTPAPAPVASSTLTEVTEVRVAAHTSSKIRMVIDFKPGSNIQYDIKQDASNIVLTLPQTGWSAQRNWSSSKIALISAYSMSPLNQGAEMIINTRGDDLTVKVFTLGPVRDGAGPRLVIDFEKGV